MSHRHRRNAARRLVDALLVLILVCLGSGWTRSAAAQDAAPAPAAAPSGAEEQRRSKCPPTRPLGLQSYEPSAFGHESKSDDVGAYNIKISVKYPLAPVALGCRWGDENRLYFAFTGYWDFYIGTRPSSPVVGKEYNPQLFWQHFLEDGGTELFTPLASVGETSAGQAPHGRTAYWTLGYAHDSDGQTTDSLSQFQQAEQSQGTEAAKDAISRGWDYVFIGFRFVPVSQPNYRVSLYPMVRMFLSHGLLQGRPEEIHDWEQVADGKQRKAVDGLSLLGKVQWHTHANADLVGDAKLAIRYGTGYQDPFRHSTVRIEAGLELLHVPVVLWGQNGYMSDLSQYYRRVSAYGIEVEIGAF